MEAKRNENDVMKLTKFLGESFWYFKIVQRRQCSSAICCYLSCVEGVGEKRHRVESRNIIKSNVLVCFSSSFCLGTRDSRVEMEQKFSFLPTQQQKSLILYPLVISLGNNQGSFLLKALVSFFSFRITIVFNFPSQDTMKTYKN